MEQSLRRGDVSVAEDWTRDLLTCLLQHGQCTDEADGLTFDLVVIRFLQLLMTGCPEDVSSLTPPPTPHLGVAGISIVLCIVYCHME